MEAGDGCEERMQASEESLLCGSDECVQQNSRTRTETRHISVDFELVFGL